MSTTENKLSFNALIINIIFLLLLIGSIVFWFYPNFQEVQTKKQNFYKTYENYEKIEKNGLNFGQLKQKVQEKINIEKKSKSKKEKLISDLELIKNSSSTFENLIKDKNLGNNKEKSFLKFLDEKNEKIKNEINSNENIILEKKIENTLPSYVENDENISTLTDFKFINYLENLLFAFSLKNDGELGIGKIVAIDSIGKNKIKADQIFYIPVKFKLEGRKGNIINFLYFIENVGIIDLIKGKKLEIKFKNNTFFDDNQNIKKYLNNTKIYNFKEDSNKGNIYNNLFADIDEIKFTEYLDSKLEDHETKNEEDFIKYINENQFYEKLKIDVTIKFYIKGLPRYKLNEEILGLIKDFSIISKEIKKELKIQESKKIEDLDVLNYSKLSSLDKYLEKKKKEILRIRKSLGKEKDLIKIYNSTKEIQEKLSEAKKIFENIKKQKVENIDNNSGKDIKNNIKTKN